MPKKLLGIILSCVLFVTLAVSASAAVPDSTVVTEETVVLANGDTITTTISVTPVYSRSVAETVTADKVIEYKTSSGIAWEFIISGTFTYNGTTARASSPSNDYGIYMDGWSCTKHTASASGASIKGAATFKHTSGLTKNTNPVLTCSPDGDFS